MVKKHIAHIVLAFLLILIAFVYGTNVGQPEVSDEELATLNIEDGLKSEQVVAKKIGPTFADKGKFEGKQEMWILVNFGKPVTTKLTTECYNNETLVENFDTEDHTFKQEEIFTWYALCKNESVTKRNVVIEYLE
ncbi:hypothetical protein HOK51_01845 [Candidatus Woesearchaeota archaeon]|jgi:hypothetical protein|nr:hypothetical protein [Candidatus Woesearchaeota archaeon]MBT6518558.1 hypothetical protein [Candidatus Woesearchaeota archaeon]MBT7366900.1 hypothetical protein [Candidatus Woesearchaeota archaeon]